MYKKKEKILNIILAVFVVIASYLLVFNVSRLYNMYSEIEIEVENYKEIEEQLTILKGKVDRINNLREGYYDERELSRIKNYFSNTYNRYSNSTLLKNRSGKYNYSEILEILRLNFSYDSLQDHSAERAIFKNDDKVTKYFLGKRFNEEFLNIALIDKLKLEISGSAFILKGDMITARMHNFYGMFLKELENINMLAEIVLENGGAK